MSACRECGEATSAKGLCSPCYNRKWATEHPELRRAARKKSYQKNRTQALSYIRQWRLAKLYGITEADFDLMLARQGDACAICRKPFTRTPHIDHNHTTGRVRGLLCGGCNLHAGFIESSLAPAIVAYLEAYRGSDITTSEVS